MLSMRVAPRLSPAVWPASVGRRAAEQHRPVIQGTWPQTVKARRADPSSSHADRDQQVTWLLDGAPTCADPVRVRSGYSTTDPPSGGSVGELMGRPALGSGGAGSGLDPLDGEQVVEAGDLQRPDDRPGGGDHPQEDAV